MRYYLYESKTQEYKYTIYTSRGEIVITTRTLAEALDYLEFTPWPTTK